MRRCQWVSAPYTAVTRRYRLPSKNSGFIKLPLIKISKCTAVNLGPRVVGRVIPVPSSITLAKGELMVGTVPADKPPSAAGSGDGTVSRGKANRGLFPFQEESSSHDKMMRCAGSLERFLLPRSMRGLYCTLHLSRFCVKATSIAGASKGTAGAWGGLKTVNRRS